MSKHAKSFRLIVVMCGLLAVALMNTGCAGFGEFMGDLAGAIEQQQKQQQQEIPRQRNTSAYGVR